VESFDFTMLSAQEKPHSSGMPQSTFTCGLVGVLVQWTVDTGRKWLCGG